MPAQPPPQDPYAELSLPPTASQDEIRRAYKRACLRWHPDKHPDGPARQEAERRFKAVSRAYTVLSDPATRAAHDAAHPAPDPFADPAYRRAFATKFAAKFAAEGNPVDPDSLFDSLFSDAHRAAFAHAANTEQPSQPPIKPPDREIDLALTLEELATGCTKKRRLRLTNPTQEAPVLSIAIRPGYRSGDRVRFRDAIPACGTNVATDVVFTLAEKPHEVFVPKGDNLHLTMRVRLVDALAGAVLLVRGVDGEDVKVRIDSVIHPGYVHIVTGRGMPRRSSPDERGDMHIAFDIIFPKRVEADDRSAVRDLFARLDLHANSRMSIRRSSSLFMGRGAAANILHPRRNSTSAQPPAAPPPAKSAAGQQEMQQPVEQPKPQDRAAGPPIPPKQKPPSGSSDGDSPKARAKREPGMSRMNKTNKTKFRFTSIFR